MAIPTPTEPHTLSFLDLPSELRLRIYRNCFVVGEVQIVDKSTNFPPDNDGYAYHVKNASSQFLQTCHTCYIEGRRILYEENVFDFPYPSSLTYFLSRTPFVYAKDWVKHVRIHPRIYWTSSLDRVDAFSNLNILTLDACDSIFEVMDDEDPTSFKTLSPYNRAAGYVLLKNIGSHVRDAEIWARGYPVVNHKPESPPQVY
jgi:hypothetical protein